MKIALLIADAEPGGLLRVTEWLADGLGAAGHDVTVVSVTHGRPSTRPGPARRWTFRALGARRLATSGPRLRRLLREGFDVVIAAEFYVGLVVATARPRRSPTAVLWIQHTALERWRDSTDRMDRIVARSAQLTCARVEGVAAVSRVAADTTDREFRRLPWPTIFLANPVLHGTEPGFGPAPHDRRHRRDVVLVGRLTRQKRVHDAIAAFAAASPSIDHDLVVIGDGPDAPDLRRLAERLGVADRVTFTGHLPDPPALMERFATLLLTSDYEGLPTVIIEGLSRGCDIVSTDCPSGPFELLDGGRYGRLVPVGDVAGLARAIEASLVDPRCTDPGLPDHLRPYTIDAALQAYETALRTVVERRRDRLARRRRRPSVT